MTVYAIDAVFQMAAVQGGLNKMDFLSRIIFCHWFISRLYVAYTFFFYYHGGVKKLCFTQLLNLMTSSMVDKHPRCQHCGNTWDTILLNDPEKPLGCSLVSYLQWGSFLGH